jgi:hypothetical protein
MTDPESLSDDDEALAWAGDEKPKPAEPAVAPDDSRVEPVETASQIPAPLLVTYGILAGVYLIYTIGWIVSVTRSSFAQLDLLSTIMFQLGQFLAIAGPALWFVTVLYLTRGRKPIIRLGLLLAGLVVTIPWPFLLGV